MIKFDPTMHPNDFPLLRSATRRLARLDAALSVIGDALEDGSIRNVALQEAKSELSNAVQESWRKHVNDPHFSGEAWRDGRMSEALRDLYYKINVYGLHDVHAAAKRIAASKVEGPAVDAMRALLQELLPLAQAVSGLKDKIVKGRVAAPPRPPANPDQLRMTCGCCMRPIAVVGGTPNGSMAHHGYERPGHGWQTASCPGVKFKPLETTDDGPRYVLALRQSQLQEAETALAACPSLTKLRIAVRERRVRVLKDITPDMPEWRNALASRVWSLESDIRALKHDIPRLELVVRNWRPETEAARALLIQRHGAIPARYLAQVEASAPTDLVPNRHEEAEAEEEADEEERGERMRG